MQPSNDTSNDTFWGRVNRRRKEFVEWIDNRLNPIFALEIRRSRKSGIFLIAVIACILIGFCLFFLAFGMPRSGSLNWEGDAQSVFTIIIFFSLIAIGSAVRSGSKMPRRYIEQDLVHFSCMSDKQIMLGYVYYGAFESFWVCLFEYLFLLAFIATNISSAFLYLLTVVFLYSFAQAMNLFSISFFAGVRKQYEFIMMGLLMYFVCGILLIVVLVQGCFIAYEIHNTVPLSFQFWALYLTCLGETYLFSLIAYHLALLCLPREDTFSGRVMKTLVIYGFTFLAIPMIFSIILHLVHNH